MDVNVGVLVTPNGDVCSFGKIDDVVAYAQPYTATFYTSYTTTLKFSNLYTIFTDVQRHTLYCALFDSYFPWRNTIESEKYQNVLRCVLINPKKTDQLFAYVLDNPLPEAHEIVHCEVWRSWQLNQNKHTITCRDKDFITGSAVGDFTEILDPKLLLK